MFTKSDLQSGMMVVTHENKTYMVIKNSLQSCLISQDGWLDLHDYKDDFTMSKGVDACFTIDKVYLFVPWYHFKIDETERPIWERKSVNKLDDLERQLHDIQEQIDQLRKE